MSERDSSKSEAVGLDREKSTASTESSASTPLQAGRELPDFAGFKMDELVSQLMEPMPSPISARDLRAVQSNFEWYSVNYVESPLGWWKANIGTDHGPVEADHDPVRWITAREPSTDISDAWRVVERMRELGFYLGLVDDGNVTEPWEAYFDQGRNKPSYNAWASSAPLAICLAALRVNLSLVDRE